MTKRSVLAPGPESVAEVKRPITWSDSVRVEEFVWVAGQVGGDEATGQLIWGESPEVTFEAQTERAFENLAKALQRAGSSLEQVIFARIYLTKHDNYKRFDRIYQRYFPTDPPARVVVVVRDNVDPAGPDFVHHGAHALVNVECVAMRGE